MNIHTCDGGGKIEAKIPAEDLGGDSLNPKSSAVNEEEEFFLLSIFTSVLLFFSQNRKANPNKIGTQEKPR